MIEDMNDKDILDKARMEGMNQGIWLAVMDVYLITGVITACILVVAI